MVAWEVGPAKRVLTLTAAALLATAAMALGQETVRLTLDEAIDLARENNPTFLRTQNNEAAADWLVDQFLEDHNVARSLQDLPVAVVASQNARYAVRDAAAGQMDVLGAGR